MPKKFKTLTNPTKQQVIKRLKAIHKSSLRSGSIPDNGLCCVTFYKCNWAIGRLFKEIMSPDNSLVTKHWGYGLPETPEAILGSDDYCFGYTPLRQSLLLLFIEYLKTDLEWL